MRFTTHLVFFQCTGCSLFRKLNSAHVVVALRMCSGCHSNRAKFQKVTIMSTVVVPPSRTQQENRLNSRKASKQSGLKPLSRQTGNFFLNTQYNFSTENWFLSTKPITWLTFFLIGLRKESLLLVIYLWCSRVLRNKLNFIRVFFLFNAHPPQKTVEPQKPSMPLH